MKNLLLVFLMLTCFLTACSFLVNPSFTLSITIVGNGTVSINSEGKVCSSHCTFQFSPDASLTLTATPAKDWGFSLWENCSGNTNSCQLNLNSNTTIKAVFEKAQAISYQLQVGKTGNGIVVSNIPGVYCGSDCSETFASATHVTLTATPDTDYVFNSWEGACQEDNPVCSLIVDKSLNVQANFTKQSIPEINILNPANNATVNTSSLTISGTATDPDGIEQLSYRLNDGSIQFVTFQDSSFQFDVTLVQGENTIELMARDSLDTEGKTTLTITYTPKNTVQVLYLQPSDRELNPDYYQAVGAAIQDVQGWYQDQVGQSFSLATKSPQVCHLPNTADYYGLDSWDKLLQDVQSCAPVSYGSEFVWVLYADVIHQCDAPGRLGAGGSGITMLPRQDMDGLIGAPYIDDCGIPYDFPETRYIGGLAHEIGHAFGLPHPPGCDENLATCDSDALMWLGYVIYPETYLRTEEKEFLLASPFFQ